jgi:hypothetical protein
VVSRVGWVDALVVTLPGVARHWRSRVGSRNVEGFRARGGEQRSFVRSRAEKMHIRCTRAVPARVFYFLACKSSVWRDLPKQPSRTLVHRPSVSTDNLEFSSGANHRGSSRLPSWRQPFPSRNLKTRVEGARKTAPVGLRKAIRICPSCGAVSARRRRR